MVYHAEPAMIPMGTLFSTPSESKFMPCFSGHYLRGINARDGV